MSRNSVPTPDEVQELVIENLKKQEFTPSEEELILLGSKLDLDEYLGEEATKSLTVRQRAFLVAFAQHPAITRAATAAGVSMMSVWNWRKHQQGFEEIFEEVQKLAISAAEQVAWKRAVNGTIEDVYGSLGTGEGTGVVGKRVVTHDGLLQFMMKHNHPAKYKDRMEIGGTGPGGAIKMIIERRIVDPKDGPQTKD